MNKKLTTAFAACCMATGLAISPPATAAEGAGPYYAVPSWSQKLPAATRFIVLSNWAGEAVLDRETALVWEKAPKSTAYMALRAAHRYCLNSTVGGRKGWRVPSVQELSSLVDPTQASPALPVGHPFVLDSIRDAVWSSTLTDETSAEGWGVIFVTSGNVGNSPVSSNFFVWCVRGGSGPEVQGR